jgi:hypothetical protein
MPPAGIEPAHVRRSPGTARKYRQLTKDFVAEFGSRSIESLTAADIELGYLLLERAEVQSRGPVFIRRFLAKTVGGLVS